MMTESILAEIDAEIARLKQVRSLLAGTGRVTAKVNGLNSGHAVPGRHKRRNLSPAARKRIADAQRRRWAAQRAKSKKQAK